MADLSQRLLDAADAIEEFNKSLPMESPPDYGWTPAELRTEAAHLADEESAVTALARDIFDGMHPRECWELVEKKFYLRAAKAAVDAGWSK